MSEVETELNINTPKPRVQKLLKLEITLFDEGSTHAQCTIYREEGPLGKLYPWRITPQEFIDVAQHSIDEYRSYLESYEDVGKDSDKPCKIGSIVLDIDTQFIVDPDYISYEEFGTKGKRKATRPGLTEFKRVIGLQVGDELLRQVMTSFTDGEV